MSQSVDDSGSMTLVGGSRVAELIDSAPLVAAWRAAVDGQAPRFTIPGHKGRAGRLSATLGQILGADVPLYGGLDTPKLTNRTLEQAEALAARCWGGTWCRFSTGGSTHANQVIAMTVGRPGDTVLVSRAMHRSTLSGLVLAGLWPVWLPMEIDRRFGMSTGVSADTVRRALADHPEAVAIFLVEPGYTGVHSGDLREVVAAAHAAEVTVVVDQAWGAHFGFHPAYPDHALAAGADGMVMSGHKAMLAFSQGAYIVTRGDRLAPDLLDRGFETSATTSPSGAILASLDATRALLESTEGRDLLELTRRRVERIRLRLREAGFTVPGPEDFPPGCFDPAKLVIRMGATGCDGLALEAALAGRGIFVEMADRTTIIPIVGLTDDDATLDRLADELVAAERPATPSPQALELDSSWTLPHSSTGPSAMAPRDAYYAPRRVVALPESVGEICAELIAPYPPGVPFLIPGERIDAEAVEALRRCADHGTRVAYAADPSLRTVLVVEAEGVGG
jgi:arginine decarboxylase